MTVHRRTARGAAYCLALGLLFISQALAAQVPDTVPTQNDTATVVVPPGGMLSDTIPDERLEKVLEQEDSIGPAPNLPEIVTPAPVGFWVARWEWNREELRRFQGLSVLELLERIPSLSVIRAGGFGTPAGIDAFGLGGGRMRVFWDGYEVDPLSSATVDLQQVALVDLEAVRVERTLGEVRVELYPLRLQDDRPLTFIELADGTQNTRLLRGLFARPIGSRSVLTLGFDLIDTSGQRVRAQADSPVGFGAPYTLTTGLARWSYAFSPRAGIQLQYQNTQVDLDYDNPANPAREVFFPLESTRQEVVLRGRASPTPRLALEGLVARSWREDAGFVNSETYGNQAVLRAVYDRGWGYLAGTGRWRFGEREGVFAPEQELSLRAGVQPLPWLRISGDTRVASGTGDPAAEWAGHAAVGPWRGVTLFANAATGARTIGQVEVDSVPLPPDAGENTLQWGRFLEFPTGRSSVSGARAGIQWSAWGAEAGAAFLKLDVDSVFPLGLAFDREVAARPGGPSSGLEATLSLPLYGPFRLAGWYARWLDEPRPYLPSEQWRVALAFHGVYRKGNLEPTLRFEALHRGTTLGPDPRGDAFSVATPARTLLNAYLQIRIVDVSAFFILQNVLGETAASDIPGFFTPGQTQIYGVRWYFRD